MVAGGLINGQVYFYDYEGMKYVTQMNCRNRSGKFSSGRKVTSLNFFSRDMNTGSISSATGNASGAIAKRKLSQSFDDNQLLVATNDNSIRLYSTIDYSIQQKFKGLKNMSMQIKASFSENRKYIISGSDDGKTYIWPTKKPLKKKTWSLFSSSKAVTKNSSYECFDNSVVDGHTNKSVSVATTVSIFCPSRSIENIIMTHPRLTSLVNHDDVELNLDHHDLCTRLIATSDYDGRMTFYLRGV
jgi:WD40 repeat protein